MPNWEYKVVQKPNTQPMTEEELNAHGAAGMELVAIHANRVDMIVVGRHEAVTTLFYHFKRQKTAQASAPARPAGQPPAPK